MQRMKNRVFHEVIKCTPYKAMFDKHVKVGLKKSSFRMTLIEHLKTEKEFQTLIGIINDLLPKTQISK